MKTKKIKMVLVPLLLISCLLIGSVSATVANNSFSLSRTEFIKGITRTGTQINATTTLVNIWNGSDTYSFNTTAINNTVVWDYDDSLVENATSIDLTFTITTTGTVNQTSFTIYVISTNTSESIPITVWLGTDGTTNYFFNMGIMVGIIGGVCLLFVAFIGIGFKMIKRL